jgi:hypothetical protein
VKAPEKKTLSHRLLKKNITLSRPVDSAKHCSAKTTAKTPQKTWFSHLLPLRIIGHGTCNKSLAVSVDDNLKFHCAINE